MVEEEEEPLPSEPEASHGQGGEAAATKVDEVVAKKVTSDLGALPPVKAQVFLLDTQLAIALYPR